MRYIKIFNRTSKNLEGTWDGRHYKIAPGAHEFPEAQAIKFRDQNPLMGSQDPVSLETQYLIGIEELGDDISPIEQSDSPVLMDITKLKIDPTIEYVIQRVAGQFRPQRGDFERNPQPPNATLSGFEPA